MQTVAAPETAGDRRGVGALAGVWSTPAALRAARATVVVPSLLAVTYEVIGNGQMATYATFGGFAHLVFASFAGSRLHKVRAHLGLGVTGSVLITIGTLINGHVVAALVVTLAVVFVVLMAGATAVNAAAGGLAALVSYVLSAASPGTASMIPSRVEGWWLGTAAAALAIALTTASGPADQLRRALIRASHTLASETAALAVGAASETDRASTIAAVVALRNSFSAVPFRPTGLATVDEALSNMVELLEWAGDLLGDTLAEGVEFGDLQQSDRALLACTARVLDDVATLLGGGDRQPQLDELERLRLLSVAATRTHREADPRFQETVHASFHARSIAVAARSAAADSLVASRRASPQEVAEQRARWLGSSVDALTPDRSLRRANLSFARAEAGAVLRRHASLRSVWTRNSARGALAVATAVTVADLTSVQHGFWVVLGTLSVLRTTATATGGTALRALVGTTIGVATGAGIVLGVGGDTTVLWLVFPVAVLVAAYSPGVAPFAVGQAAFTTVLVVLYNLLIPVGWKIGVVRVEDIALGCAISVVIGVLLWPRGATSAVTDDLVEAFSTAARYLVHAVDWAIGRDTPPLDAGRAALVASLRLDDGLRSLLSEQGPRLVNKDDLWAWSVESSGCGSPLRPSPSYRFLRRPRRSPPCCRREHDCSAAGMRRWPPACTAVARGYRLPSPPLRPPPLVPRPLMPSRSASGPPA